MTLRFRQIGDKVHRDVDSTGMGIGGGQVEHELTNLLMSTNMLGHQYFPCVRAYVP